MTSVCESPLPLTSFPSDDPVPEPDPESEIVTSVEDANDESTQEIEKKSVVMVDVSSGPDSVNSTINEEPIDKPQLRNSNRPKTVPSFMHSNKSPEHYLNGFSVCRRRVLKPPGGGSSDIFGQGAGGGVENSPRRVRNYVNSSQLFSDNAASSSSNTTSSSNGSIPNSNGTTASNKPGNDSHERLFGPPLNRPPSAVKDRLKSNILIGVDAANDNQNNMLNGNHQNGNNDHTDGNPVTGEGYSTPLQKSPPTSANSSNGEINGRQPPLRNRVPPGGFSSGLW